MSVGVNVTCELRWLNSVLSEDDLKFLRSRVDSLNQLGEALRDLHTAVYRIDVRPVVAEYVPLHQTYYPVWARVQDVASGWEERAGVFPYIIEKATHVTYLGKLVSQLDDAVAEGKSPWAFDEPLCNRVVTEIGVVEARLQGLRWMISALLGHYAY